MSTETKPKPKTLRYRVKGSGNGIDIVGFVAGTITDERLNGPEGSNLIKAIQNHERERNVQIMGKLIVME